MIFDYKKLRGKIIEMYGSQSAFVKDFGTSENTFSRKLNNKVRFSVDDITLIIKLLKIQTYEIGEYFFYRQSLTF